MKITNKIYYIKFFLFFFVFNFSCPLLTLDQETEGVFTDIYKQNFWKDKESISGTGSNLPSTRIIRDELPKLLKQLNIKTLLDAPCGDLFWIKRIIKKSGIKEYIGLDIVEDLIVKNRRRFSAKQLSLKNISFMHADIINDPLPYADIILCRDALQHFSYQDIISALKNFKKSGAKYLLLTTFTEQKDREFVEISTGDWRPINWNMPPFNFPTPIFMINEQCPQEGFPDKCLALWDLNDIEK